MTKKIPTGYDGDEEAVEENEGSPKALVTEHFGFYEQPYGGKIYHFYVSSDISGPQNYVQMIQTIRSAGPNDVVYIYLNTDGGRLDTGVQIINAMKNSQAHIATVVEGSCCSLGTIIFLHGDEMVAQPHALFMIHNHSGGAVGKGHEYMAQATATTRWFERLAKETYLGFLTEDELNRMLKGEDFWMDADEVNRRLKKYVKHLEKIAKEEEEAELAKTMKRKGSKKTTE